MISSIAFTMYPATGCSVCAIDICLATFPHPECSMVNVECNEALQFNIEHSLFKIYRSHSPSRRLRKASAPTRMPAAGSVSRSITWTPW